MHALYKFKPVYLLTLRNLGQQLFSPQDILLSFNFNYCFSLISTLFFNELFNLKTNQNVIPKLFVSLSSEVRTQTPWKLKKPNKSTSVVQCLNKRKTKPRKLINTLVYYHQKTV